MKETKINIYEYILILALTIICIISSVQRNKLEARYENLEHSYYGLQIEYAEEFAEIETACEFLDGYLEKLKKAYNNLEEKYDVLLEAYVDEDNATSETNEEFKEKLINDVDDLIDYYWNYVSFVEHNPDITFSQYVKIKNVALHTRIKEYFNWTDWE